MRIRCRYPFWHLQIRVVDQMIDYSPKFDAEALLIVVMLFIDRVPWSTGRGIDPASYMSRANEVEICAGKMTMDLAVVLLQKELFILRLTHRNIEFVFSNHVVKRKATSMNTVLRDEVFEQVMVTLPNESANHVFVGQLTHADCQR